MDKNWALLIGGACVAISAGQSLYLLIQHLRYFCMPDYQLYICRIILMVPIYCITSCLSIVHPSFTETFNMIRDCYEAFVIYSFTMLLINYIGGDRRLLITLELKERIEHPWPFNYLFHSFHPGATFLRLVKIGVLHFVLFRPLLSFIALIMSSFGLYHNNYYGLDDSYLYIFILSNISFTLALYGLLLFYVTTEELLEPYRPLPKFICIKAVIFFSFWQGIGLSFLENIGVITGNSEMNAQETSAMLQNVLVCIEMLIASFAHAWAFSYEEYREKPQEEYTPLNNHSMANNIKSILLAQDVIKEVKDSISPIEYDFELQKNDN